MPVGYLKPFKFVIFLLEQGMQGNMLCMNKYTNICSVTYELGCEFYYIH